MFVKTLLLVAVVGCLFCIDNSNGARILGFFPSPSKSHLIIHCSVADILAQEGHDVTVIASLPNIFSKAKYKYIQIEGPKMDVKFASSLISKPVPIYKKFPSLIENMASLANETMAHPKMRQFLLDNGKGSFDLLILGYFMNDFNLGLGAHFDCPVVFNFMIRPVLHLNAYIGNPLEVSYVPLLFGGMHQPLGFIDRVKNFLCFLLENLVLQTYLDYKTQIYYDYHFPADRYPPLQELRQNVSLVLTNHHSESQGPIRPNVPALIEIGGIQIKENPDPLPADIAEHVAKAKNGFIYFSLGTVVQGNFLHEERAKIMFNVVSKLPYLVLWKWGEGEVPGNASNVIYKKWLPQDDLLAQPNCKLFITHGGQGSVVESQYHGVPMVGIPLFGDQPANMANVVRLGFGLSVDYLSISEEGFSASVEEVLNNPKYAKAVKHFSKIYRDRPMSPKKTLIYWIDYILRYRGAKHIQSPAVHLSQLQLLSLDVIAFLLGILVIILSVIILSIKLCCCRKKNKVLKVSQTKKNK